MASLNFDTHRNFFKTYPNSFTTWVCPHDLNVRADNDKRDDACLNLASLKFSQSTRTADPKDPTRIVTTTTTTTFSMSREMAKGICQHFMDCHLVENATDIMAGFFKDRGIYMLTPKGLHILERFVSKNGITTDHLLKLFATQPITMKLLHLERRSGDDEVIITRNVIEVLFRRFVGRIPNLTKLNEDEILAHYYSRFYTKTPSLPAGETLDRSEGIIVRKPGGGEKTTSSDDYIFSARAAVNWMLDFTSATGIDEAAEILAHFVRYGLITLVSDKGKIKEENLIVSARGGGAGGGAGALMASNFRIHILVEI